MAKKSTPHLEWLSIAENDLKAAKRLLFDEYPLIAQAAQLAQQCAEKSFKRHLDNVLELGLC